MILSMKCGFKLLVDMWFENASLTLCEAHTEVLVLFMFSLGEVLTVAN